MGVTLSRSIALVAIALAEMVTPSFAQETHRSQEGGAFAVPGDVSVRKATIWSDGTRMAANLYARKSAAGRLPTIIMAYGRGAERWSAFIPRPQRLLKQTISSSCSTTEAGA
jgi:hypothetical protein